METNSLVPNAEFRALVLVSFVVLVVWPLTEVIVRRRILWALAIFFLAPVGGIAWLLLGRWIDTRRARQLDRQPA
jgi:hypothetical protein